MTTPQRPLELPIDATNGWDDDRLRAAFAARAARAVVPAGLAAGAIERLRPGAGVPWWRRYAPVGVVAVLAIAVVGAGIAILGSADGRLGSTNGVAFRQGPTADLRTLQVATFELDFPAEWRGYDATGPFEGTALAVLSSTDLPCGRDETIDITCVYEAPLAPGEARLIVGVVPMRTGSILERADIEDGTSTRLSLAGMPAVLDERETLPDDFYEADLAATWSIGTPTSLSQVVELDLRAREPHAGDARVIANAIAASLRFTPPPAPLPDDPAEATAAARAVLDAEAAAFRQGFVPAADADGQTYLDCLPDAPGEDRVVGIDYGPGGDLGWTVLTRCRWTVVADERGPFWRIDTVYEWTVGEDFGRYRESFWIDAAGLVVARSNSGEVPPAGDHSGKPTPTPTPEPTAPAWGPWPPDGAEVIDLPNENGNDPARVAVVDLSGALTEVRAPTAQDGHPEGPDEAFFRDPSGDGRYRLRWGTTICDREMTVTIDAEVDRIVIDHAPRDGCDSMGIGRELVLVFSRDVDPASVAYVHNRAVLLPEPPPEPTVTIVDLTRGDTIDRIIVTDHTGSLMEARPAVVADVSVEVRIATGVRLARLEDGGTVVIWDGSMCDSDFSITIEADDPGPPDRITVQNVAARACRTALIQRAVWLDLGPVDVDAIAVRHDVATAPAVPEALGLGVMDVQAALAVQARSGDDREIAVRGWIWRLDPATLDCLIFERSAVEELFFGQGCRSDSLMTTEGGTFDDPTLRLVLGQGISDSLPYGLRVEVVLVGHFDDRRSSECTAPRVARCADMFWVDAVSLPTSRDWTDPVRGGDPARHTHDDAWERVRGPEEDPLVALSVNLMTGSSLQHLEPAAVGSIPLERWNWHVTAYEPSSGRLRTFVIPDSVLDNYEGIVRYEVVGDEVVITTAIID